MAGVLYASGGVPLTEYCVVSGAWLTNKCVVRGEWFPTARTGWLARTTCNHAPLTTHEFVP